MLECSEYSNFLTYVMIGVEVQVLIGVCRLKVDGYLCSLVWKHMYLSFQECELLAVLHVAIIMS